MSEVDDCALCFFGEGEIEIDDEMLCIDCADMVNEETGVW